MKNKKSNFEFSLLEINSKHGLHSVMNSLIVPRQVSILGVNIKNTYFENSGYYGYSSELITDYRIFIQ